MTKHRAPGTWASLLSSTSKELPSPHPSTPDADGKLSLPSEAGWQVAGARARGGSAHVPTAPASLGERIPAHGTPAAAPSPVLGPARASPPLLQLLAQARRSRMDPITSTVRCQACGQAFPSFTRLAQHLGAKHNGVNSDEVKYLVLRAAASQQPAPAPLPSHPAQAGGARGSKGPRTRPGDQHDAPAQADGEGGGGLAASAASLTGVGHSGVCPDTLLSWPALPSASGQQAKPQVATATAAQGLPSQGAVQHQSQEQQGQKGRWGWQRPEAGPGGRAASPAPALPSPIAHPPSPRPVRHPALGHGPGLGPPPRASRGSAVTLTLGSLLRLPPGQRPTPGRGSLPAAKAKGIAPQASRAAASGKAGAVLAWPGLRILTPGKGGVSGVNRRAAAVRTVVEVKGRRRLRAEGAAPRKKRVSLVKQQVLRQRADKVLAAAQQQLGRAEEVVGRLVAHQERLERELLRVEQGAGPPLTQPPLVMQQSGSVPGQQSGSGQLHGVDQQPAGQLQQRGEGSAGELYKGLGGGGPLCLAGAEGQGGPAPGSASATRARSTDPGGERGAGAHPIAAPPLMAPAPSLSTQGAGGAGAGAVGGRAEAGGDATGRSPSLAGLAARLQPTAPVFTPAARPGQPSTAGTAASQVFCATNAPTPAPAPALLPEAAATPSSPPAATLPGPVPIPEPPPVPPLPPLLPPGLPPGVCAAALRVSLTQLQTKVKAAQAAVAAAQAGLAAAQRQWNSAHKVPQPTEEPAVVVVVDPAEPDDLCGSAGQAGGAGEGELPPQVVVVVGAAEGTDAAEQAASGPWLGSGSSKTGAALRRHLHPNPS